MIKKKLVIEPIVRETLDPPHRITTSDPGVYITIYQQPSITYLTTEDGFIITTEGT